jgi:RimJ/RimL family protein N-acetyltransferase
VPADTITFRPVAVADLPLLADWLSRPHWQEWWGDAETELGYIRDMLEGRDTTEPFLILLNGSPAGYIQMWHIKDARVEPWITQAPWVADLPDDAVGVDLSLADPACLSRGIGTATLVAFVARLRDAGQREIYIDPDPENLRAVRSYEKAGFRAVETLLGQTGDSLIMRHDLKETTP